MARKEIRICKCGHIHIFDDEIINQTITENKELVLICGNCGTAYKIGADEEDGSSVGEPNRIYFNMYTQDVNNSATFSIENFVNNEENKAIKTIFYSKGIAIPMKSGMEANAFFIDKFFDTYYPNFLSEINRQNITVEEIQQLKQQWETNRSTVDMHELCENIDKLTAKILIHAKITALDFKGTKYENLLNPQKKKQSASQQDKT